MARHRAARSVKTVNLKPFVLDDVSAAAPSSARSEPGATPTSLEGRELLDERRRRWELERERFERSRRAPTAAPPSADSDSDGADP
jgi:hypothetical protein